MGFEDKLNKLKDISDKLDGKVSLNEGIDLFQSSLGITKECLDELNDIKGKINVIKAEMDKLLSETEE